MATGKKNEKQGFEFIDTESYLLRTNDTFQYIDLMQRHMHVMWLPSTCTAQSLPTEEAFQMRSFWLKNKKQKQTPTFSSLQSYFNSFIHKCMYGE